MKKKYENLEIFCEGNEVHTGEDIKVFLDGKSIVHEWGITQIKWKMNPDKGMINIYYCKDRKTGEMALTKKGDEILESIVRIKYPVKNINLDYKWLGIKSDNTPLGTKFYFDEKEIKNSGIIEFDVCIGNAETVNEITITTC